MYELIMSQIYLVRQSRMRLIGIAKNVMIYGNRKQSLFTLEPSL
jgi:hypothetical protein